MSTDQTLFQRPEFVTGLKFFETIRCLLVRKTNPTFGPLEVLLYAPSLAVNAKICMSNVTTRHLTMATTQQQILPAHSLD